MAAKPKASKASKSAAPARALSKKDMKKTKGGLVFNFKLVAVKTGG